MKGKIKKISRCMLWFFTCLFLSFIDGCGDNQSKEVIYVSGFSVVLLRLPNQGAWLPDAWAVSDDAQGTYICGFAFGFPLQLTDENNEEYHEAGIRVDIEVVGHWSAAGFGDIWDKEAPNGEKYGFIRVFPGEGSGWHDGVFHGRTNSNGRLFIFPGLGDPEGTFDPNAPLDYGYKLPGPGGSYSDVFDTVVQLKITVPRKHMPMQPVYIWCSFNRMQYQNFWWPENNGVYHNSRQGIGELGGNSMQTQSLESEAITTELSDVKKTPKGKASDYPLDTKTRTGKAVTATDATSGGPSLDWAHWYQLRWDSYYGWYWDDPAKMHALWAADANDPNDMMDAMTTCEPYALWADISLPEPFDGNDAHSTVVLRSVNKTTGEVFSKMPMCMYLVGKSPDNKLLTMVSDFVVIVERPEDQGYYYDEWGYLYAAIYAPQGSILEVDFSEPFGDFNADDLVDYQDMSLLTKHWLDSANDPNATYDAMYEEPNNWDGSVDFQDFAAFADNWLAESN